MTIKHIKRALIIGGLLGLGFLLYRVFGKSVRYQIPSGFKGWVRLQCSASNCPPLIREGFFLIAIVDQSGKFCTSSPFPANLVYQKFEYIYPGDVHKSLRWNDHGEPGTQVWLEGYDEHTQSELIFVGEEHENWNLYQRPR